MNVLRVAAFAAIVYLVMVAAVGFFMMNVFGSEFVW